MASNDLEMFLSEEETNFENESLEDISASDINHNVSLGAPLGVPDADNLLSSVGSWSIRIFATFLRRLILDTNVGGLDVGPLPERFLRYVTVVSSYDQWLKELDEFCTRTESFGCVIGFGVE